MRGGGTKNRLLAELDNWAVSGKGVTDEASPQISLK